VQQVATLPAHRVGLVTCLLLLELCGVGDDVSDKLWVMLGVVNVILGHLVSDCPHCQRVCRF
jgi:hypothetical protein